MQSTLEIFKHLFEHLPPLFPADRKEKIAQTIRELKDNPASSLESLEDTMIVFGYEIWPWNQAFRELMASAETDIGEHFLLPKLSEAVANKYHDFIKYGGSFRDLHAGKPASFFSLEDRGELCRALVDMQVDLRKYVRRDIAGLKQKHYLARVEDFKNLIKDIKLTLGHLRNLAEAEHDHPTLADEIRARVRHFEHGLCLLGPNLEYEAVCQAPDFFNGRKHELNRLKGIHTSKAFTLV